LRFVKHRAHSALSLLEPDIAVKPTGDVTGIEVKLYTAKGKIGILNVKIFYFYLNMY